MAKRVLPDYYSFNPGTRTITITNKVVKPQQLLLELYLTTILPAWEPQTLWPS